MLVKPGPSTWWLWTLYVRAQGLSITGQEATYSLAVGYFLELVAQLLSNTLRPTKSEGVGKANELRRRLQNSQRVTCSPSRINNAHRDSRDPQYHVGDRISMQKHGLLDSVPCRAS